MIANSHLIYYALRTLEDALARANHAPVPPTWGIRLALLYIRSTGVGLNWHWQEFEDRLAYQRPQDHDGGQYVRTTGLTGLLDYWYRELKLTRPDCVQRGKWAAKYKPTIDDNPRDLPFDLSDYESQHSTMCNLYTLDRQMDDVAKYFGAHNNAGNTPAGEVYPQYPGAVIRNTEHGRELTGMTWGWPLAMKGKHGQPLKPRPVNNTRTDKLLSAFWKSAAIRSSQRCLIPVTAFAEAVGPRGQMKRTWLSVPDEETFICAGIWRDSIEWGNVYSMVMTDARHDLLHVHDRMPVILSPNAYETWLTAPIEEAIKLCVAWPKPLHENSTQELWGKRKSNDTGSSESVLL